MDTNGKRNTVNKPRSKPSDSAVRVIEAKPEHGAEVQGVQASAKQTGTDPWAEMQRRIKATNKQAYRVECSGADLQVIKQSLELYFRLHMGQYEELIQTVMIYYAKTDAGPDHDRLSRARELAKQLLAIQFPTLQGGYQGIRSSELHSSAHRACNIYQDIRYRLAWDTNPEGSWTCEYDKPMYVHHHTPLRIAKIEAGNGAQ